MKYISFVIPCYNSQDYMERCIASLVIGGEEVEVIIVDDGSTDRTGEIADYYETLYPNIIRVVHKENGGHGSGVNKGLELATGFYFKVVDSDDWLEEKAYKKVLTKLRALYSKEDKADLNGTPDLVVCNYVYDHLEQKIEQPVRFDNVFPIETLCNWNDIKRFRPSQYLVMHTLIFRTQLLRECDIKLPEHTFYVDNLFANQPLPLVKSIYYINADLYHYYLGREDQSVNENVLIKRIDQQILVTNLVSRCVNLTEIKKQYSRLAVYLKRNISIMVSISCIHLLLMNSKESYRKRRELWRGIKEYDKSLYYSLRYTTLSGFTYLPGKIGGQITIGGYRLAKKIYKFQ